MNASPSTLMVVVPSNVISTASERPMQSELKTKISKIHESHTESTRIPHHERRHLHVVSLLYLLFFSPCSCSLSDLTSLLLVEVVDGGKTESDKEKISSSETFFTILILRR